MLTSTEFVDKTDYVDPNEVQNAGYGTDFLNNFIDDTPRSSLSALDSVIGSQNGHKLQSDLLPESDALPEAAGLVYHTVAELNSESPSHSTKDTQRPIILSSSFSFPQQLDSPEVCIEKLHNACHALNGLTIPPVEPQRHVPSPTTWLKGKSESVSFSDEDVDLSDEDNGAHDSVDALLAAAAGCDQDADNQTADNDGAYVGQPDEDVLLLINKAIEILRHHIVYIRGLEASQQRSSGRAKPSRKNKWNTAAEQSALSTLEPLLYGGATNIGCLITSERADLLWQLYSQLTHLVTAPYMALARSQKPTTKDRNAQYRAVDPSKKRSLQPRRGKAAKIPDPHKFLSRQKNPS